MAQNQAHIGDTVSPVVGDFKGEHGKIVALRDGSNRCMVRLSEDGDPNHCIDVQYDGNDLKLIDCYHMGVTINE